MTEEKRPVSIDDNKAMPSAVETSKSNDADAERRAVLSRLGKMAALTAPAVVTLMMTKRASAASPQPPN